MVWFVLSIGLSFFLYVFLSLCLSFSLSFFLYVFLSLCLSFSMSFFLYVFLCLSFSLSFFLFVFLSLCLAFSLSFFLSFFLSLWMKGIKLFHRIKIYLLIQKSFTTFNIIIIITMQTSQCDHSWERYSW